jgi:hypothetical protein
MSGHLYHYTCDHGRQSLGRRGLVQPQPHPFLGVRLAWFTDQAIPNREGLGLTMEHIPCDRLAFRYIARKGEPVPWIGSFVRRSARPDVLAMLESEGAQPLTWWVTTTSTLVELDRSWPVGGR